MAVEIQDTCMLYKYKDFHTDQEPPLPLFLDPQAGLCNPYNSLTTHGSKCSIHSLESLKAEAGSMLLR